MDDLGVSIYVYVKLISFCCFSEKRWNFVEKNVLCGILIVKNSPAELTFSFFQLITGYYINKNSLKLRNFGSQKKRSEAIQTV